MSKEFYMIVFYLQKRHSLDKITRQRIGRQCHVLKILVRVLISDRISIYSIVP